VVAVAEDEAKKTNRHAAAPTPLVDDKMTFMMLLLLL
jgi:hypothetical protein